MEISSINLERYPEVKKIIKLELIERIVHLTNRELLSIVNEEKIKSARVENIMIISKITGVRVRGVMKTLSSDITSLSKYFLHLFYMVIALSFIGSFQWNMRDKIDFEGAIILATLITIKIGMIDILYINILDNKKQNIDIKKMLLDVKEDMPYINSIADISSEYINKIDEHINKYKDKDSNIRNKKEEHDSNFEIQKLTETLNYHIKKYLPWYM